MNLSRFFRQISRAISVMRTNGAKTFLRKAASKVRQTIGLPDKDHQHYLRHKATIDNAFDDGRGIDTGGIQRLHDMTIDSENARYGTSHIASDPREFADAIRSIDIPIDHFTFIDLGSGKGRALMLALDFPFDRVIGVEFAQELHDICRSNIARLAPSDPRVSRIEPVRGDASTYGLPNTPLVIFLFHPFDSPMMKAVAAHALASWKAAPRPIRVVYVNPVYLDDWTDAGWVLTVREGFHAVLSPPSS